MKINENFNISGHPSSTNNTAHVALLTLNTTETNKPGPKTVQFDRLDHI